MSNNISNTDMTELRSEERELAPVYSSVEFHLKDMNIGYHCKVRDISPKGLCIVLNETSPVLNYIHVGDRIDMKYHSDDRYEGSQLKTTEIIYISRPDEGKYKGHVLVGLSVA